MHRREFIAASAAAAALGLLGCSHTSPITGSFLQPWRSHLSWPPAQWHARLLATQRLGIRELFLQWSGISGRGPAWSWQLPDALLLQLLEQCAELGLGLHIGLPYDERWWQAIGYTASGTAQDMDAFMASIEAQGRAHMQRSTWPAHPAFRGWYIPYEIEQYHWVSSARVDLLVRTLQGLAATALATSAAAPSVSTYFSQLQTSGTLHQLWGQLLEAAPLHPMVQDGVGVAGLQNYAALAPLQSLLQQRQQPFDLIVELFEQLPSLQPDGSDFRAQSASLGRVQKQWRVASTYGAQRVVAFAVDPWVLESDARAQRLYRFWPRPRP